MNPSSDIRAVAANLPGCDPINQILFVRNPLIYELRINGRAHINPMVLLQIMAGAGL
jgi:hypothetical protein